MAIHKKNPRSRLIIAIVLICASFFSALAFAALSNHRQSFWVAKSFIVPGHVIEFSDLSKADVILGNLSSNYYPSSRDLVGHLAVERFEAGELISTIGVDEFGTGPQLSSVPISVRVADIPSDTTVGDVVDVYSVFDSQNGELTPAPQLILEGTTVKQLSKSGQNFGSEVAISLSVDPNQVMSLVQATALGRLVLVSTHG